MPDKAHFRTRMIIQDKEGHYIIIKGSVFQEDLTIFDMYIPNQTESKDTM